MSQDQREDTGLPPGGLPLYTDEHPPPDMAERVSLTPVVAPAPAPTNPLEQSYPLQVGAPDAIVIQCADPRFRRAFANFLQDLGIENPAVIAIAGSVKAFGLSAYLPKDWYALKKQIELMAKHNQQTPRVILFTHEDCKGYEASGGFLKRLLKKLPIKKIQEGHLTALAEYIREKYLPSAEFDLYHAAIVDTGGGQEVKFEQVF